MVEAVKRALITGITGQDGSYLAELLLQKGYEVHGTVRRSSSFNTGRIDPIFDRLKLHFADMLDVESIRNAVDRSGPDEVYHLAAQSHVRVSFDQPDYTHDVIAQGTSRLLRAVRDMCPEARVYVASSSEMFGNTPGPLNERSRFVPVSPYGIAKLAAHHTAVMYRETYDLHVSCGILFNHEGPRRGETFVTRKIAKAAARISMGKQDKLYLGDLMPKRDWGFAAEYVEAMWLMLQQYKPDDYVIAMGQSHSVQEFLDLAFACAGINQTGPYVGIAERYTRPSEIQNLVGDATKAHDVLGWYPRTSFKELVRMMVDHEMREAGR